MRIMRAVALLTIALHAHASADTTALPADVQRYIKAADNCQHLAGEWDSELPRSEQKRIKRDIHKYCSSASRQRKVLLVKYKHHPAVRQLLEGTQHQAVTDFRR